MRVNASNNFLKLIFEVYPWQSRISDQTKFVPEHSLLILKPRNRLLEMSCRDELTFDFKTEKNFVPELNLQKSLCRLPKIIPVNTPRGISPSSLFGFNTFSFIRTFRNFSVNLRTKVMQQFHHFTTPSLAIDER